MAISGGPALKLFLGGDTMTGRGIDQILPHPVSPVLYEPWVQSAETYVTLAEQVHGALPRQVDPGYIWGDALDVWARQAPDARIVNLETSVTDRAEHWPGKSVHYRMHPANLACLEAARIDVCALANNHVIDWGYAGMLETLASLDQWQIRHAGAGERAEVAERPAVVDVGDRGRVLVFSAGTHSAGIPGAWAADDASAGLFVVDEDANGDIAHIARRVRAAKRPGDVVVFSIHWGGNWGFSIPDAQIAFAHRLIDEAGIDVVHGHSAHHVKAIERYRGKLILYGMGELIDDYEGIGGHEAYRGELGMLCFPRIDPRDGRLLSLEIVPTRIRRFRVERASDAEARWLADLLDRESRPFGTRVTRAEPATLQVPC